jgi:hypothetical protein
VETRKWVDASAKPRPGQWRLASYRSHGSAVANPYEYETDYRRDLRLSKHAPLSQILGRLGTTSRNLLVKKQCASLVVALEALEPGDTFVITTLDRLGQ